MLNLNNISSQTWGNFKCQSHLHRLSTDCLNRGEAEDCVHCEDTARLILLTWRKRDWAFPVQSSLTLTVRLTLLNMAQSKLSFFSPKLLDFDCNCTRRNSCTTKSLFRHLNNIAPVSNGSFLAWFVYSQLLRESDLSVARNFSMPEPLLLISQTVLVTNQLHIAAQDGDLVHVHTTEWWRILESSYSNIPNCRH